MEEKNQETDKVCVCLRVGHRGRRLKIERGPRKEDRKWEKGVSLRVKRERYHNCLCA